MIIEKVVPETQPVEKIYVEPNCAFKHLNQHQFLFNGKRIQTRK